jgi:serine/threonine-protein kinase
MSDDDAWSKLALDKTALMGGETRELTATQESPVDNARAALRADAPEQVTARLQARAVEIAVADQAAGNTLPSAGVPARPTPGEVAIGQVLAGKYEILRLLGHGGMGKVWKGLHLGLGVPIAIKTMHADIASRTDYVRRFRREAHAASLLDHPNAVRVLDFGDDGGTLYLVMEYLEGRSLRAWLSDRGEPPPLVDVALILRMLLDAFDVAHKYGIVHRDLKPDNVFVTEAAGKRTVKVVDFGLAHVDDARDQGPTLTKNDVIAGTPEYMSPEQCRSLAVGPSADLYAIGCVLTELLQLRPPFRGSTAIEVLSRQMFTPPPPLDRPAGAEPVPPLLERLRLDLLAKSPDRRPRDAAEARERLLEAMSPEATEARLPTRKGDEPLGDRAARAPTWKTADAAPETTRTRQRAIGLLRITGDAAGVNPECETGLAAQKLEVIQVRDVGDVGGRALGVLVLDAGADHDQARRLLEEIAKIARSCRVVVCASELSTDRMNALVAAGAADVARYPVTPDALARKVERVLRRGR